MILVLLFPFMVLLVVGSFTSAAVKQLSSPKARISLILVGLLAGGRLAWEAMLYGIYVHDKARTEGRIRACLSQRRELRTAVLKYEEETREKLPELARLDPRYLPAYFKEVPKCYGHSVFYDGEAQAVYPYELKNGEVLCTAPQAVRTFSAWKAKRTRLNADSGL